MSVVLRNAAECAAQRAFLFGGESVALNKDADEFRPPGTYQELERLEELTQRALTARRRYWRELACSEALLGRPWADADALGEVRNG